MPWSIVRLFEDCYFRRLLDNSVFRAEDFAALWYVGNRLTVVHKFIQHTDVITAFLHEEVYIPPSWLEYEEGVPFLGFSVKLEQR